MPTIQLSVSTIEALLNDTVTIRFTIANVDFNKTVHWEFKMTGSDSFLPVNETSVNVSINMTSLTISHVQLNDSGIYKISVTNEVGTRDATVTLLVYG